MEALSVRIVVPKGYGTAKLFCDDCGFVMIDRPSALEIALDAIDDDFKAAVAQFVRNYAGDNDAGKLKAGYEKQLQVRSDVAALVEALALLKAKAL